MDKRWAIQIMAATSIPGMDANILSAAITTDIISRGIALESILIEEVKNGERKKD